MNTCLPYGLVPDGLQGFSIPSELCAESAGLLLSPTLLGDNACHTEGVPGGLSFVSVRTERGPDERFVYAYATAFVVQLVKHFVTNRGFALKNPGASWPSFAEPTVISVTRVAAGREVESKWVTPTAVSLLCLVRAARCHISPSPFHRSATRFCAVYSIASLKVENRVARSRAPKSVSSCPTNSPAWWRNSADSAS